MIPLHLPPGDTSTERTLQIDGTSEQIEAAKQLVNEVISEVCVISVCLKIWPCTLVVCCSLNLLNLMRSKLK